MRIINGIKYHNIFNKRTDNCCDNMVCFICQEIIKPEDEFYADNNDYLGNIVSNSKAIVIHICATCVRSTKEAEDRIIPLVKILYGGIIEVKRKYYNKVGYKIFKY